MSREKQNQPCEANWFLRVSRNEVSEADVRLLIDCVMLVFLRDGVDRDELPPDRLAMLEERAGLSAATNRGDAVVRGGREMKQGQSGTN